MKSIEKVQENINTRAIISSLTCGSENHLTTYRVQNLKGKVRSLKDVKTLLTHLWKRSEKIFAAKDWLHSWTIKSRIGFPF